MMKKNPIKTLSKLSRKTMMIVGISAAIIGAAVLLSTFAASPKPKHGCEVANKYGDHEVLKKGNKGACVKHFQQRLNTVLKGVSPDIKVDGTWGTATQAKFHDWMRIKCSPFYDGDETTFYQGHWGELHSGETCKGA